MNDKTLFDVKPGDCVYGIVRKGDWFTVVTLAVTAITRTSLIAGGRKYDMDGGDIVRGHRQYEVPARVFVAKAEVEPEVERQNRSACKQLVRWAAKSAVEGMTTEEQIEFLAARGIPVPSVPPIVDQEARS